MAKPTGGAHFGKLRSNAERRIDSLGAKLESLLPPDAQQLVHELQVHHIELEMQHDELQRALEDLRLSRDRFSSLFELAPIGFFVLGQDYCIRGVNLAGKLLVGNAYLSRVRQPFANLIAHECRHACDDFLARTFAGEETERCELIFRQGDARLFVQAEATVLASGRECLVAVMDITARKKMEEALILSRTELEERVMERTAELGVAHRRQQEEMANRLEAVEELGKRELLLIQQSRMAAMGEMVTNIAHQWRQPLNVIGLLAQQTGLFHEQGLLTSQMLAENMAKIHDILRFLSQTIDDFREFTLPDKEKRLFGVSQVVAKTLHLVDDLFRKEKISIETGCDGKAQINGFPNEFSQVLLNLLMNARDAFDDYGAADRRIRVNSWTEAGRTIVTVADNAGGIGADIMDRIFDPYFSTKGEKAGSGVGLYMARTIVEKSLGGRLSVSNTNGGAEFRIEV